MVAKIGRGSNLYGALAYNNLKVEHENGKILLANKMIETPSGQYSVAQLVSSFEPYLVANRNTEKHTLHISLNPDPKDKVNDDRFKELAEEYMNKMGYGDQPYVVFKHTDISRTHIHIVSVCVNEEGKKISDKFEKRRSMNVCRDLETKYGLIPATNKEQERNDKIFLPVNYRNGDVKKQIGSVITHLPNYYKFRTLGEYNALLSLFNISAEKIVSEQQGLMYFSLNEKGEKVGHPFKSSLFGKHTGLPSLDLHFKNSQEKLKITNSSTTLKALIGMVLSSTNDEMDFKKQLVQHGVNVVVRRNDSGRIYGITFIDHNSKSVWNGSRLGKEFSANIFNDRWNDQSHKDQAVDSHITKTTASSEKLLGEETHKLFDFLDNSATTDKSEDLFTDSIGGFLPLLEGDDHEEEDFARRMKCRRKRKL